MSDVARYLRTLGSTGASAAQRIEQVWKDIGSYTPSSAYATISPAEAAATIERSHFARAHWLTLARNVLILLPLLLTWIALAWATYTYQQELAKSPNDVYYPLLDLWQRDFTLTGSASAWHWNSFSQVAAIDASIFVALIIVGLAADILATRARTTAKMAQGRLEDVTMQMCHYCAELKITESGFPDMQQWSEQIRDTINAASLATQNATESLLRMSNLAAQFQTNVNVLEQSAQSVSTSAGGLATAVSGVVTSAVEMKSAAEAAALAQQNSVDELRKVLTNVESLARSSGATAAEVRQMSTDIIAGFKRSSDALDRAAATMQNAAERMGGEYRPQPALDVEDEPPKGCFPFFGGGRRVKRATAQPTPAIPVRVASPVGVKRAEPFGSYGAPAPARPPFQQPNPPLYMPPRAPTVPQEPAPPDRESRVPLWPSAPGAVPEEPPYPSALGDD